MLDIYIENIYSRVKITYIRVHNFRNQTNIMHNIQKWHTVCCKKINYSQILLKISKCRYGIQQKFSEKMDVSIHLLKKTYKI